MPGDHARSSGSEKHDGRGDVRRLGQLSHRRHREHALVQRGIIDDGFGQLGAHPCRRHRIHADAALRPFDGKRAREVDDRAFRGPQMRRRCLRQEKRRAQIGAQQIVPLLSPEAEGVAEPQEAVP